MPPMKLYIYIYISISYRPWRFCEAFQQFYEAPQVNQQMMYWQPAMNQFNQQRLPMQNYVPEGMVLVVVPVVLLGVRPMPRDP